MARRLDEMLTARARDHRANPSEPERRLWNAIRSRQIGFKFRRQAAIAPYIVDFLCPYNGLIVEIDGDTHDEARDRVRDKHLTHAGYRVLRFGNSDVMSNLEAVLEQIAETAAHLPERRKITHPHPSLGREGLSE